MPEIGERQLVVEDRGAASREEPEIQQQWRQDQARERERHNREGALLESCFNDPSIEALIPGQEI